MYMTKKNHYLRIKIFNKIIYDTFDKIKTVLIKILNNK